MGTSERGYQVKARDREGTIHDERWTTDPETARQVVRDLEDDPFVEAAWIEPDPDA